MATALLQQPERCAQHETRPPLAASPWPSTWPPGRPPSRTRRPRLGTRGGGTEQEQCAGWKRRPARAVGAATPAAAGRQGTVATAQRPQLITRGVRALALLKSVMVMDTSEYASAANRPACMPHTSLAAPAAGFSSFLAAISVGASGFAGSLVRGPPLDSLVVTPAGSRGDGVGVGCAGAFMEPSRRQEEREEPGAARGQDTRGGARAGRGRGWRGKWGGARAERRVLFPRGGRAKFGTPVRGVRLFGGGRKGEGTGDLL